MDLSKIQIIFQEPTKIGKIISDINLENVPNSINDKIKAYLNIKAIQIIKFHNPYLDFNIYNNHINNKSNVFMLHYLPRYVFMVAYTTTHVNHPYLIYFNLDDKFINVLIPMGCNYQQADTQYYIDVINSITLSSYTSKNNTNNMAILSAIYLLIKNTIDTRKYGIIYSPLFSILTCENMILCYNKMNDIIKMNIDINEKKELYKKYEEYYKKIGMKLLEKYFYLLETKEFSEAYQFLKGGDTKLDKYYKKTRLNNFFRNNKSILGHVEVFISLYEILHMVRSKLYY